MGQIDDFLNAQVSPQLVQGEQIMWFGHARRPYRFNKLGVPSHYEDWLATATNLRLILFQTDAGGVITPKPKPMCKEVREWWYQELKQVHCANVEGLTQARYFSPIPHEPLGPYEGEAKRYDVFPTVTGVDGQGNFFGQYGAWLQQQVAAGAFPMDAERQARVQAHEQQKALEAEQQRQQKAERSAARAAGMRKLGRALAPIWLLLIVVSLFGGCVTTGLLAYESYDYWGDYSERLEEDRKKLKETRAKAKTSKVAANDLKYDLDRLEKDVDMGKYDVERKRTETLMYGAPTGLGGLLVVACGVLWFVMHRKRRRAFEEQDGAADGNPPAEAGAPGADPAAAPGHYPSAADPNAVAAQAPAGGYGPQPGQAPVPQPAAYGQQPGQAPVPQPAAYGQPTPGYGQPPGGTGQQY
jgi:hypothetical protein